MKMITPTYHISTIPQALLNKTQRSLSYLSLFFPSHLFITTCPAIQIYLQLSQHVQCSHILSIAHAVLSTPKEFCHPAFYSLNSYLFFRNYLTGHLILSIMLGPFSLCFSVSCRNSWPNPLPYRKEEFFWEPSMCQTPVLGWVSIDYLI